METINCTVCIVHQYNITTSPQPGAITHQHMVSDKYKYKQQANCSTKRSRELPKDRSTSGSMWNWWSLRHNRSHDRCYTYKQTTHAVQQASNPLKSAPSCGRSGLLCLIHTWANLGLPSQLASQSVQSFPHDHHQFIFHNETALHNTHRKNNSERLPEKPQSSMNWHGSQLWSAHIHIPREMA